jgi:hypothetical protein
VDWIHRDEWWAPANTVMDFGVTEVRGAVFD